MRNRITGTLVGMLIFGCLCSTSLKAQVNIYKLHSLFMYNFTKHVQWSEVGDNFTLGVFGSDLALKEVKANFEGKKYGGKDFRVINVAGIGDANACQMVYFPKSNKNKILDLFESANKNDILYVSEDDLVAFGIDISFTVNGTTLGFLVSKKNLEASGLKMSSSLLSLADVVD